MNSGAGTSATGLAVQGACHPALAAMRYPLHRPANRSNGIQQTRLYQAAPARICLAMPMSARPCFCMATFDSRPCSRERCAARWSIRPRTRPDPADLLPPRGDRVSCVELFPHPSWQCERCKIRSLDTSLAQLRPSKPDPGDRRTGPI
ncbi:hypothetical protein L1887_57186 [Cichorium endivia]|nr:hypothetical protein L1887_57186 [Cichorium endivia]